VCATHIRVDALDSSEMRRDMSNITAVTTRLASAAVSNYDSSMNTHMRRLALVSAGAAVGLVALLGVRFAARQREAPRVADGAGWNAAERQRDPAGFMMSAETRLRQHREALRGSEEGVRQAIGLLDKELERVNAARRPLDQQAEHLRAAYRKAERVGDAAYPISVAGQIRTREQLIEATRAALIAQAPQARAATGLAAARADAVARADALAARVAQTDALLKALPDRRARMGQGAPDAATAEWLGALQDQVAANEQALTVSMQAPAASDPAVPEGEPAAEVDVMAFLLAPAAP
jgi:hypothetical protein